MNDFLARFKKKRKLLNKKNQEFSTNVARKIKRLNTQQRVIFGLFAICLSLFAMSYIMGDYRVSPSIASIIPQKAIVANVKTVDKLDFSAFAHVQKFEVPNAKKTVVYIPQIHREPTSNPNDPVNNQAAVIQKEIYTDLRKLVDDNHIKLVMDETDNYGPMPQDKVNKIKQGFADIQSFRDSLNKALDLYLKDGGSQDIADQLRKAGEDRIAKFERNIYLTGGAAVLAAQDSNAQVYGSQNPATIAEATKELQNIVFMEQRMSQLQQPQNGGAGQSGAIPQNILSILGSSNNNSGTPYNPNPVMALASQKQDQTLIQDMNEANQKLTKLSTGRTFETTPTAVQTAPPTNPYANETNLAKLQQEHDQAVTKFMKLAKDQRSQEVSDNMAKAMDANGQDVGVLVLGAQHQDQLVSDLNAKGINVIVITPDTEVQYNANQAAAAGATNSTDNSNPVDTANTPASANKVNTNPVTA